MSSSNVTKIVIASSVAAARGLHMGFQFPLAMMCVSLGHCHALVTREALVGEDWKQAIVAELCAQVLCHGGLD